MVRRATAVHCCLWAEGGDRPVARLPQTSAIVYILDITGHRKWTHFCADEIPLLGGKEEVSFKLGPLLG